MKDNKENIFNEEDFVISGEGSENEPEYDLDDEIVNNEIELSSFEHLDDSLSDIDFSDIRGDFKSSFKKTKKKVVKNHAAKGRLKTKGASRKPLAKKKKPLTKEFPVKKGASIFGRGTKKIGRIIVPNDKKVIVEGVNKFILSNDSKNEALRNIGYYKGEKLKEMVLIFNNDSALDFNLELFNPSMPLDYLYNTSLNLNDKIQVAGGGAASYSDVLFNLLANPAMIVNAKFVFAGASMTSQMNQSIQVKNKNIEGVEKVEPINMNLQLDNMQVQANEVSFNLMDTLNRPFIPDGMDVMRYKILAGMTVVMAFFCKQVSLKKYFYEEAAKNKKLL